MGKIKIASGSEVFLAQPIHSKDYCSNFCGENKAKPQQLIMKRCSFSFQNSFPHSQMKNTDSNNFITGGKKHLDFNVINGHIISYYIKQRKDVCFLSYNIMEILYSLIVVHAFPRHFK